MKGKYPKTTRRTTLPLRHEIQEFSDTLTDSQCEDLLDVNISAATNICSTDNTTRYPKLSPEESLDLTNAAWDLRTRIRKD